MALPSLGPAQSTCVSVLSFVCTISDQVHNNKTGHRLGLYVTPKRGWQTTFDLFTPDTQAPGGGGGKLLLPPLDTRPTTLDVQIILNVVDITIILVLSAFQQVLHKIIQFDLHVNFMQEF